MLNLIQLYLQRLRSIKERLGIYTARPRSIKIGEGEVLLKNFTKEQANELENLITGTSVVGGEVTVGESKEEPDTSSFDKSALSMVKNEQGEWLLVELNYNLNNKMGMVIDVKNYSKEKEIALGDFRIKAVKLFLDK